jgi:hypothetical protein
MGQARSREAEHGERRGKMKTMFLAASAALSLGIGSAYADGGGQAPTLFTIIQGQQQAARTHAIPAENTTVVRSYGTRSQTEGTWLFPANQNEGSGN